MSERLAFVQSCLRHHESVLQVCARFGISEKTGQKWLKRFREGGPEAIVERSHARHTQAHRMSSTVSARVVALRQAHPLYGPRKLYDWLVQHHPAQRWPSPSAIGDLLKREQLVRGAHRRQYPVERARLEGSRSTATEANAVWTADFKGEFRLLGGPYCFPLTVLDLFSHYLLGCRALASTAVVSAHQTFERLFREFGLPRVLRTDNGVPFAQPNALGRFGALAFWWVRLGIRPEHIALGRPAENGAHERFHRTLKASATHPASRSYGAQQRRFDSFRTEYNTDRPHESVINHRPPGHVYTSSSRPYPSKLPDIVYPDPTTVRLVDTAGTIKWQNCPIFLSTNLSGQYVSLIETEKDHVTIAYSTLQLGEFNPHTHRFLPRVRWDSGVDTRLP